MIKKLYNLFSCNNSRYFLSAKKSRILQKTKKNHKNLMKLLKNYLCSVRFLMMKNLNELRASIDSIDSKIIKLLNERAGYAIEIGEIKKVENRPTWAPEREKAIFDSLKEQAGILSFNSLKNIFREIISACIALEQKIQVGYFGQSGTFANMAAVKRFGNSAELTPLGGVRDVFEGVEKGRVKYGIIPIENTLEGIVNNSIDMFMDTNLVIVGEIYVEIAQNLLNKSGDKKDITHIYSHPHAIAQCRNWLYKHMPNVPVSPVESTAKAAEMAANNPAIAAIGSQMAESVYDLRILQQHIEDEPLNYTRFLIIGKDAIKPSGHDITSVMFGIKHEPGSLCDALEVLKSGGVNMTTLESRPSRQKPWEYLFYANLDGHKDDEKIATVLNIFRKKVSLIKILGSYPKSEL